MQTAGGSRAAGSKLIDDTEQRRAFAIGRRAESLSCTFGRCAEIADAAGLLTVGHVAEVANQRRHPALIGFGVADHQIDLRSLLIPLGNIRVAPRGLAASDSFRVIQNSSTVNP